MKPKFFSFNTPEICRRDREMMEFIQKNCGAPRMPLRDQLPAHYKKKDVDKT